MEILTGYSKHITQQCIEKVNNSLTSTNACNLLAATCSLHRKEVHCSTGGGRLHNCGQLVSKNWYYSV